MDKTCSKCKKDFSCLNESGGCWCEGISLTNETLEILKKNYENCLCPECLTSYQDIPEVKSEQ